MHKRWRKGRREVLPALGLLWGLQGVAQAQTVAAPADTLDARLQAQERRLNELEQQLVRERAQLRALRQAVGEQQLGAASGRGTAPAGEATVAQAASPSAPVGRAPESASRAPEIAPISEQPGVLTPRGRWVLEPSLQYGYSSNNRVALLGYSVIPALVIGLIDVREVKRNTTTAAITARYGLSNRMEVEARLPYVYRSDSTVSREVGTGTAVSNVFDTSGSGIGDIELAGRYQFNNGGADMPYFIGGLRFKSRTGRDPFEVTTDCVQRCIGNSNVTGTGLPLELPTGSGFYSLQPTLTWLYPSDPVVFFGTFSYLHNFKRQVSRTVLGGAQEDLGTVAPGDALGFNIGMGLSLNDKASFSIGYDHSTIGRTKQNGITVPGSVRLQLGTLLLGFSYRLTPQRTLNVSIGAGLTPDTPNTTITVRVPMQL